MANVKFTLECEMEERWVNDFCSMLKTMEHYGSAGHSAMIGFYSDGDGDFRPKFNIGTNFEQKNGYSGKGKNISVFFDAG